MDEDSPRSLNNWIDKFELQCAPKEKMGYFGALYFIGLVIGSLTLPRLSDNFGRKRFALFGDIMHVIASFTIW